MGQYSYSNLNSENILTDTFSSHLSTFWPNTFPDASVKFVHYLMIKNLNNLSTMRSQINQM